MILYVRDLQNELAELSDELYYLKIAVEEAKDVIDDAEGEPTDEELEALDEANDALNAFDHGRLKELDDLLSEVDRDSTLVDEQGFDDYVRDMLSDQGIEIPAWVEIDWEATCKNVAMDYTVVTFDNEDWYVI
jgi:hypothetical protein